MTRVYNNPIDLNEETKGRLFLWEGAVLETKSLLEMADRSLEALKNQGHITEERDKYIEALKTFREDTPDADILKKEFDQSYYRPFPAESECFEISNVSRLLAIVIFCQILNPGNKKKGVVASNPRSFMSPNFELSDQLTSICNSIFQSEEEHLKFKNLCSKLLEVRNTLIAHADGEAYDVKRSDYLVTMRSHRDGLKGIDFSFWLSFLEKMRVGILEVANHK